MELAGARPSTCAGCSPCADDSDRQTHQCGFSDRSLDTAGQHHDPRARPGSCAAAARGRIDGERADAAAAGSGRRTGGAGSRAGGGQEAGCAEASAHGSTGAVGTCAWFGFDSG